MTRRFTNASQSQGLLGFARLPLRERGVKCLKSQGQVESQSPASLAEFLGTSDPSRPPRVDGDPLTGASETKSWNGHNGYSV